DPLARVSSTCRRRRRTPEYRVIVRAGSNGPWGADMATRHGNDKDLDFTGKTILVTGSGRNIGRAIVLEFAARGANVIINSRTNETEARSVDQEAQALGAKTLVVRGTAGELQTVEELKRRAEDKLGRVDIYVSNAA